MDDLRRQLEFAKQRIYAHEHGLPMPTPPPPAKRLDSHGKPAPPRSPVDNEEDDESSAWSSDEEQEGKNGKEDEGKGEEEGKGEDDVVGLDQLRNELEKARKRAVQAEVASSKNLADVEALEKEVSKTKAEWSTVKVEAEELKVAVAAAKEVAAKAAKVAKEAAAKYNLALGLAQKDKEIAETQKTRVESIAMQKHQQVTALSRQLAALTQEREALAADNRKYRTKIGHMELSSKRPRGVHKVSECVSTGAHRQNDHRLCVRRVRNPYIRHAPTAQGAQYDVDGNLVSNEITFKSLVTMCEEGVLDFNESKSEGMTEELIERFVGFLSSHQRNAVAVAVKRMDPPAAGGDPVSSLGRALNDDKEFEQKVLGRLEQTVTPIKINPQLAKTIELAQPKLKPKDEPQNGFGVGSRGVGLPEESPLAGKGPKSPRRLPGATKTRWSATATATSGGAAPSQSLLSATKLTSAQMPAASAPAPVFVPVPAPVSVRPAPIPVVPPPDWAEYHDDAGHVYYHNAKTGETTWTEPANFRAANGALPGEEEAAAAEEAAGATDADPIRRHGRALKLKGVGGKHGLTEEEVRMQPGGRPSVSTHLCLEQAGR